MVKGRRGAAAVPFHNMFDSQMSLVVQVALVSLSAPVIRYEIKTTAHSLVKRATLSPPSVHTPNTKANFGLASELNLSSTEPRADNVRHAK